MGNLATSIQDRPTQAQVVCQTREESITWFENWLGEQLTVRNPTVCDFMNRLYKAAVTGDIWLICWCSPKSCHTEVIKRFLEEKINERITTTT